MAGSTTIGVLGRTWRATVRPGGTVAPWDGGPELAWYVAADDRWHVPEDEITVRQTRIEGTPVVETRVRIPSGDAVHRVYAVADHGGLTVVQVENDSPLPIAVAFSHAAVLSPRPPTDAPIAGIDLPAGAVLFPVGHHATLTVAVAHDGRGAGPLAPGWPAADQVVRGWRTVVDRAGRFDVPDAAHVAEVVHARCELLLGGPVVPQEDPIAFLLGVDQLVRMTADADHWVPDVADAAGRVLRLPDAWDQRAAIDAATRVLLSAGEARAVRDLGRHRRDAAAPELPAGPPDGVRRLAWAERRLVSDGDLFPLGLPVDWLGQSIELLGLPAGPASSVSFAIRWHGARPAVLWEATGEPVVLRAPRVAPAWSSGDSRGEALWPAPVDLAAAGTASGLGPSTVASIDPDGASFS